MKHRRSVLRYAWAAPATLVGLAVALLARTAGANVALTDGVLEVSGGRLLPWLMRPRAITFGHVVIGVSHDVLADCRCHELVHVRQYERWGVFFFPLYLGSSLLQLLRGRDPYWDNYFERQAYREERGH